MERFKNFMAMEGNIPILLMCYFILGFSLGLWSPILNIYLDAIGIPIVLIGLTNTISRGFQSAVTMPIGALSDKVGRKKPILASFIITLIVTIAFLLVRKIYLLILIFAAQGVAMEMRITSFTAYMADSVNRRGEGQLMRHYLSFRCYLLYLEHL
jgi:MFS family permease